jgi:hypothetical protein
MKKQLILLSILTGSYMLSIAQNRVEVPPSVDLQMYDIIRQISSDRIGKDVIKLANFGTRNIFSDTISSHTLARICNLCQYKEKIINSNSAS